MAPDRQEALVAQSTVFQGLAPADVTAVLQRAKRVRIDRGVPLFRQGARAAAMYLLVRGKIKLIQVHPDGREVIVRIIGPGDVFGAVAVLGDMVYPVSAEAMQAGDALAWDGRAMARLLARYPAVALNAIRILVARVHELQDRLYELASERVEQRLAQAVLRLIAKAGTKVEEGVLIDMPLSRRDLAELAGTTLYTASRILSRWESQGVVAAGPRRVLVRDSLGLVSISERATAAERPPAKR